MTDRETKSEKRRKRRLALLLLLSLLALLIIALAGVTFSAHAGGGPAKPTITSAPPNPSASTDAQFAFSGESGATFECRLDATSFTPCTSPTPTYSGFSLGRHTFGVRAAKHGDTSAEATSTWSVVVPATPEVIGPANHTQATAATFSFTTNVSNATFQCRLDGGAFAPCSSPKTYSGPLSVAGHTFRVRALGPSGSSAGTSSPASYHWTIGVKNPSAASTDHPHRHRHRPDSGNGNGNGGSSGPGVVTDDTPPATPTFTLTPPDPSSSATSHFAWTDSTPEDVDHYECSRENRSFTTCATPLTYVVRTTSNGSHRFSVRAVDAVGNPSRPASYSWKVAKGSPEDFTIDGDVSGLVPGIWFAIPITITNPNSVAIHITQIVVTPAGSPGGCNASNLEVQARNAPPLAELVVPANATSWPVPASWRPRIRLKNLATNQNDCKHRTFSLNYRGGAHS